MLQGRALQDHYRPVCDRFMLPAILTTADLPLSI
jgi:hypothetical protein